MDVSPLTLSGCFTPDIFVEKGKGVGTPCVVCGALVLVLCCGRWWHPRELLAVRSCCVVAAVGCVRARAQVNIEYTQNCVRMRKTFFVFSLSFARAINTCEWMFHPLTLSGCFTPDIFVEKGIGVGTPFVSFGL